MVKILLISGHGAGDPGALGYQGITENSQTIEMVNLIAERLNGRCELVIYPHNRNAYKDVQNGTFAVSLSGIDYALEVHFNASNGKGDGSEIYVTTRESGILVEQNIMKQMDKYFDLRDNDNIFDGVKKTNFLVINWLKNKGISGSLLETCFIDNVSDMNIYLNNKRNIAFDIADSIAMSYGMKPITPEPVIKPKFLARGHVQNIGWMGWYPNIIGTVGKELRLEAMQFDTELKVTKVSLHIQNKGWIEYININKDTIMGTIGESLRIECINIECDNLEYRVHQQNVGWTSWTKADGKSTLGSVGQELRIEAIEFRIV